VVIPIDRAAWFEDQVHTLPAYQCGASAEAKAEGPNGGNILCPSTMGKGSPTDQLNSLFLLSAIFSLELMKAKVKNEDRSRTKTITKANNFINLRLIFLFLGCIYLILAKSNRNRQLSSLFTKSNVFRERRG
jgi:hypothetical protein